MCCFLGVLPSLLALLQVQVISRCQCEGFRTERSPGHRMWFHRRTRRSEQDLWERHFVGLPFLWPWNHSEGHRINRSTNTSCNLLQQRIYRLSIHSSLHHPPITSTTERERERGRERKRSQRNRHRQRERESKRMKRVREESKIKEGVRK